MPRVCGLVGDLRSCERGHFYAPSRTGYGAPIGGARRPLSSSAAVLRIASTTVTGNASIARSVA